MEFKRLTTSGGDLYKKAADLYSISFPIHEQRKSDSQTGIMDNQGYHFNLVYDDEDIWVGIVLYWETETFIYVEHFCILPDMRGKKYGQKVLEQLSREGKTIILEIDPPVDEVSIHRESFYKRAGYRANGFNHVHPPYREGFDGHSLIVMSYPDPLSEPEYTIFNDYLNFVVMEE